jgi:uridine phosphorylase
MTPAELPLNADGSLYHLGIRPAELAPNVVLVGDPDRLSLFEPELDSITARGGKREFRWLTGTAKGVPVTILSTGIGTDNVEIVLTELDAARAFDFSTRQPLPDVQALRLLRIGTCGAVQQGVEPGTFILSRAALGLDALGPYYPTTATLLEHQLLQAAEPLQQALPRGAPLYTAEAHEALHIQLLAGITGQPVLEGITLTCPGFYHPQSRTLGRATAPAPWWKVATTVECNGLRLHNLEMETAGLFRLARALGHAAASLSVVLAGRSSGSFHPNPAQAVQQVVQHSFRAFVEACRVP